MDEMAAVGQQRDRHDPRIADERQQDQHRGGARLPMTIIAGRPKRSDSAPPYRQPKMPPKPYMETMVPATPALTCMSDTRYMERNDVTKRPIHRISSVTHKPQNMRGNPKISLFFSILAIISSNIERTRRQ